MPNKPAGGIAGWWRHYRRWILLLIAAYVLVMLVLIFMPNGAQKAPFLYQIF